jgi:hypothetical protein
MPMQKNEERENDAFNHATAIHYTENEGKKKRKQCFQL